MTDIPARHPDELDRFEIGGEDLLSPTREAPADPSAQPTPAPERKWVKIREDIRIRTGTLLKTETVSFLLGAGASLECGGVLMGSVPIQVERLLLQEGVRGTARPRVHRWLRLFYLAARAQCDKDSVPISREDILLRRARAAGPGIPPAELPVNLEALLSTLYRWRAALPETPARIRLHGPPRVDASTADLDLCLRHATAALARVCHLPADGREVGLAAYTDLIRKLLTRPLNLKRVSLCQRSSETDQFSTLVGALGSDTGLFVDLDEDEDDGCGRCGKQRLRGFPSSYGRALCVHGSGGVHGPRAGGRQCVRVA